MCRVDQFWAWRIMIHRERQEEGRQPALCKTFFCHNPQHNVLYQVVHVHTRINSCVLESDITELCIWMENLKQCRLVGITLWEDTDYSCKQWDPTSIKLRVIEKLKEGGCERLERAVWRDHIALCTVYNVAATMCIVQCGSQCVRPWENLVAETEAGWLATTSAS